MGNWTKLEVPLIYANFYSNLKKVAEFTFKTQHKLNQASNLKKCKSSFKEEQLTEISGCIRRKQVTTTPMFHWRHKNKKIVLKNSSVCVRE